MPGIESVTFAPSKRETAHSISPFIPTEAKLATYPTNWTGIMSLEEHHSFRDIFKIEGPFHAYNPSPPFTNHPDEYMAVRVDSSIGTKSIIFKNDSEGLSPHPRTFDFEDPFVTNICGEIILGGVQVDKLPNGDISSWRTVLCRGKTINELRPFFVGPDGMKDIRISQSEENGKIDVYTRPRNPGNEEEGGDGQIGYRTFNSLDELENSPSGALDIKNAPILASFRFEGGKWGGVNQVHPIKNGRFQGWNFLLIHIAYKDFIDGKQKRHYSSGALLHNTRTGEVKDLGIIAKRSDFPEAKWKGMEEGNPDLEDVYFGTSLSSIDSDEPVLYGGLGDRNIGIKKIQNPLLNVA